MLNITAKRRFDSKHVLNPEKMKKQSNLVDRINYIETDCDLKKKLQTI